MTTAVAGPPSMPSWAPRQAHQSARKKVRHLPPTPAHAARRPKWIACLPAAEMPACLHVDELRCWLTGWPCIDAGLCRRERALMTEVALWRRLAAEFCGSAFLAAVVIGSGIAAAKLSPGDVGLELMENAAATAAGLFAIILMFGPVSGGHFNPVVSFADAALGGLRWRDAAAYLPVQVTGCVTGAVVANLMFAQAAASISTKHRATGAHFLSKVIATL